MMIFQGVVIEWDDYGPQYTHPHPSPRHVMSTYRKDILKAKRKWGTARGLIHYRRLLDEYRGAKRLVVALKGKS